MLVQNNDVVTAGEEYCLYLLRSAAVLPRLMWRRYQSIHAPRMAWAESQFAQAMLASRSDKGKEGMLT